ncbi:GAF domain-containing protein [Paenibacillus camelliae]|uniref:GAF domain-containing protein n=1 Tax=Paenibacillus camelliae TaxID=512410 RepID=UPI00203E8A4F|nr:GAF domain-containing protein [Paenibacillus camelliae]MCM3634408.1 GAF domain-containing protein [Paenibacillus camelliae]
MTPTTVHIENILQRLTEITLSDFTAIGTANTHTRKIQWRPYFGSISSRTVKIKQQIYSGLTGDALRTGRFLQSNAASSHASDYSEAIMLIEKLKHIAVWPIYHKGQQCRVVILIGKREQVSYEPHQITAASKLIEELEQNGDFPMLCFNESVPCK